MAHTTMGVTASLGSSPQALPPAPQPQTTSLQPWALSALDKPRLWPQDGQVDGGKVAESFTPLVPETMTMTVPGNPQGSL